MVVDKEKTYVIRSFKDRNVALRLLSMGVQPGQELKIVRKSPFGRCYFISVGSRWIAARSEELNTMELQEVQIED